MGIKYICGACGHVIYEFNRVGNYLGLVSPENIAKVFKTCPNCGKPLEYPTLDNWKGKIVVKVKLKKW